MFKTIDEVYDFLFNRRVSLKKDKASFRKLMDELDNPYLKLNCIHIAGTNGKGSTTNYLRSILQAAGYKVGSFTSPHLVKYNDRIRINNEWIDDETLINYVNRYHDLWLNHDLSMFEINMFLSIYYFIENEVDFAIYEVGIGGRLDTTNVISAKLSLITNIGFDHQELLGDTLEEIAFEKVGIVKAGGNLLTSETKVECLEVFLSEVTARNAKMKQVKASAVELIDNEVHFKYDDESYHLNTSALYQVENATLAIAAASWLKSQGLINFETDTMKAAVYQANWPGRFEIISKNPLIILDGAHNIPGMTRLVKEMSHLPEPRYVVFSALKDKDYSEMLDLLTSKSKNVIVTEFDYPRALSAKELASGHQVTIIDDYLMAYNYALEKLNSGKNPGGCIIITGSLYFISEIRSKLVKE